MDRVGVANWMQPQAIFCIEREVVVFAGLPLTILMIYPMMVTLNIRTVLSGCDWKLQGTTQLINFLVIPAVGYGLGRLFFPDRPLMALGLLLISLLPTSGMTISWTGFAKGNMQVAVKMTIIGLAAGALLAPLYLQLSMDQAVEMSLSKTFQQILTAVVVPVILGLITQTLLVRRYGGERFRRDIKPVFPLLSTIAVLGIIFVAMALRARAIVDNPATILGLIPPLLAFYGINYLVATLTGRVLYPRGDAIALVYGSVMRNLSVAMAISLVAFGQQGLEVALIIAVAYVIQVQSAAWYLRLVDRLFGGFEAPAAEAA